MTKHMEHDYKLSTAKYYLTQNNSQLAFCSNI